MKALVYRGPGRLDWADVPEPSPAADACVVQVEAAALTPIELQAIEGRDPRRANPDEMQPFVLGHAGAGRVVGGASDGAGVVINPVWGCGLCEACQVGRTNLCSARQVLSLPPHRGLFAQKVVVPAKAVMRRPAHFAPEAASLIAPLASAWHTVRMARRAVPWGRRALVLGQCVHAIGAVLALRAQGVDAVRLASEGAAAAGAAQAAGRAVGLAVQSTAELRGHDPFDLVIDAAGAQWSVDAALCLVAPGGVVAQIGRGQGAGPNLSKLYLNEITVIGTYAFTEQDFQTAALAAFEGRLGPLDWVEERKMKDGQAAFEAVAQGDVSAPVVVLRAPGA